MLHIILEQSLKWSSPLYFNFVDYEKAFGSFNLQTLWKLLRHYGMLEKITNIIKNWHEGVNCRVVYGWQLTDAFEIRTGVREGFLLLPVMFLLAMDWVMKTSTGQVQSGIQWTLWRKLDDLDYADDLVLVFHTGHRLKEKASAVADT